MSSTSYTQVPQSSRAFRRPQHSWTIRQRPFWFQPMVIAPVLPGETLKSAMFQIRAVTDPINNPLIGWWFETYWFYIKHRDLAGREDFTAMMLDPNYSMAGYDAATNPLYFHVNGTESPAINWSKLCLDEVVEWYGRFEGETAATAVIDGMPCARIDNNSALDSAILESDLHVDDVALIDAATADVLYASEVEASMRTYEMLKMNNLVSMSYEDYLRSYGVHQKSEESHKPELLRFTRDWQYPSNTINSSNGSAVSAVSWSIRESISKDRFFREPGFIFAMQVVRPKVYLENYRGSLTSWMNSAQSWLPAVMSDDPRTSLKKFVANDGPLNQTSAAYWLDLKDLFIYGEQYVNHTMTAAVKYSQTALPAAGLSDQAAKVYPPDIAALRRFFVDTAGTNGFPLDADLIRSDGVVNFNILGRLADTSEMRVGAVNV